MAQFGRTLHAHPHSVDVNALDPQVVGKFLGPLRPLLRQPLIQLLLCGMDDTFNFFVGTPDRQSELLFPSLHGADALAQIQGNLFPRRQQLGSLMSDGCGHFYSLPRNAKRIKCALCATSIIDAGRLPCNRSFRPLATNKFRCSAALASRILDENRPWSRSDTSSATARHGNFYCAGLAFCNNNLALAFGRPTGSPAVATDHCLLANPHRSFFPANLAFWLAGARCRIRAIRVDGLCLLATGDLG